MPETTHAEAIKSSVSVKAPKSDKEEFVKNLMQESKDAERDRDSWMQKVHRNYKKRFGIRPSKKNHPWPGAANHHVFLSDEKVRRMKPNYLNMAFEGDPIVRFEPLGATPPEVAQNAEIFMDWKLKYDMSRAPGFNYMESLALIIDDMVGHYGFGIGKVVWHQESRHRTTVINLDNSNAEVRQILDDPLITDQELVMIIQQVLGLDPEDPFEGKQIDSAIDQFRKGKRLIRIKERYVAYKGSTLYHIEPYLITVPKDTTHIQTARWIKHDMFMNLNDLKIAQRDGKYNDNVDKVEELKPRMYKEFYSTLEATKQSKEGNFTFANEEDLYKISEYYGYFDIDGDGVGEKVVVTVLEDTGDSEPLILRFIEYPYDHGKWPFVIFRNELTDERYYSSRGLVEMLDHYQTIVTNMQNAKEDRMTISNSLPLKARINSINPDNIRWLPGQPIWVKRIDDVESMALPQVDVSYDQEIAKVMTYAEKYIGQPDLNLGAMQGQERRTAFEVSEAVSHGRQIFSLEARLWKNSLAELYDQIYELEMQYGDEVTYIRVVGEEKNTTDDGTQIPPYLRLNKEQIRGNFVIVPNGEFTLLSRTLEERRDMELLTLALQDQSGAINHLEFWRHVLRKKDPRLAKKGLRSNQEFQQIQQQAQMQAQAEFEKKMKIAGRSE